MKQTLYDYCKNSNKQYLLDEWDYKSNDSIGLFIDKLSYCSGKIANWICSNSHKYQKRIDTRTSSNSKCPYCESRKKILLTGFNDLATTYPSLLKDWDYDKNTIIDPEKILPTSTKKVWWKCKKCNGSWQAVIRQRTLVGQGCPFCTHHKVLIGKNDLQSLFPEIAKDWNYDKNTITPYSISAYSGKKVWWKCRYCKFEWQTAVYNRTGKKTNCPSCTMKTTSFGEQALFYYIKKIFNDAINRYHNYNIELDVFIPSKNIGIEFDGLYWHNSIESIKREEKKYKICKEHNIFLIRIKDSSSRLEKEICDYCLQIDNLKNQTQLENMIKMLLKKLTHDNNLSINTDSNHFDNSIDFQINIDKDRFDILENKYLRSEKNSFIYKFPKLAKEWNYDKNKSFDPKALTKSSIIKVWWKCYKCGSEWEASIADRTNNHKNCPICSNIKLKEGVNDFATLYPKLLNEWNYDKNEISPNKILKKYSTKVWWKCQKCGYSWEANIGERTRKDKPTGCPNCKIINSSLVKHLKALNRGSLEQTHPEILCEWDYDKNSIKPNEVTHGCAIYVWRKCKYCNYSWKTTINNWTRKKSKCPQCKKKD